MSSIAETFLQDLERADEIQIFGDLKRPDWLLISLRISETWLTLSFQSLNPSLHWRWPFLRPRQKIRFGYSLLPFDPKEWFHDMIAVGDVKRLHDAADYWRKVRSTREAIRLSGNFRRASDSRKGK